MQWCLEYVASKAFKWFYAQGVNVKPLSAAHSRFWTKKQTRTAKKRKACRLDTPLATYTTSPFHFLYRGIPKKRSSSQMMTWGAISSHLISWNCLSSSFVQDSIASFESVDLEPIPPSVLLTKVFLRTGREIDVDCQVMKIC